MGLYSYPYCLLEIVLVFVNLLGLLEPVVEDVVEVVVVVVLVVAVVVV